MEKKEAKNSDMSEVHSESKRQNDELRIREIYWPKDTLYKMLVILDISFILVVTLTVSFLDGKNLTSIKTFVITLFTFTLTNAIPTIYENFKLDILQNVNDKIIKINKRKLTVVGNVFNIIVIGSLIIAQSIIAGITWYMFLIVLIIFFAVLFIMCLLAWNSHKKDEEKKRNQEKQNQEEQHQEK